MIGILTLTSLILALRLAMASTDSTILIIKLLVFSSLISLLHFATLILELNFTFTQLVVLIILLLFNIGIKANVSKFILSNKSLSIRSSDCFSISLILIGFIFFNRYSHPFGGWDGHMIWNLRASYLIDPLHWRNGFSEFIHDTHPDYPLFIPILISTLSKGFNINISFASSLFHLGIFGLLLGLFYTSLRKYNHGWLMTLAFLLLCLDRSIIAKMASQYADASIALFLLATTILLIQNKRKPFLIGVICINLIWIKNEGMIPFTLFLLYFCYLFRKDYQHLLRFFFGVLLIVLPYLYFKQSIAIDNVLFFTSSESSQSSQIFESYRYKIIFKSLINNITSYYFVLIPLFTITLVVIKRYKTKSILIAFLTLTITLLAYSSAYLLTVYEITWHLQHSFDRLIFQIYPSFLYLGLIALTHSKRFNNLLEYLPH